MDRLSPTEEEDEYIARLVSYQQDFAGVQPSTSGNVLDELWHSYRGGNLDLVVGLNGLDRDAIIPPTGSMTAENLLAHRAMLTQLIINLTKQQRYPDFHSKKKD